MLIRIADRVLQDAQWHPLLDVIASLVERNGNPHSFDPLDYSKLLASNWLAGAKGTRTLIAATLAASAKSIALQGISDAVTVEVDTNSSEAGETVGGVVHIHPFGALFLLTQPLQVIVEDETTDGGFILWVARALGIDIIAKAYRLGALSFRHAGGKGQMVKSASAISFGVWPRDMRPIRSMRLRAAAVLDSDAKHPTDAPNVTIRDAVAQHVSFVHVLARRTIENYVPGQYLRARMGSGARDRVEAYLRLTDPQRRHFPIKRGFRSETDVPVTQGELAVQPGRSALEVALYGGVTAEDWAMINSGFGDGVSAVFTDQRYRCEPNSIGLFDPTDTQELRSLLRRIVRNL